MVTVGSLDAWLEANRHGESDRASSPRWSAATAQSAPTTPAKAISSLPTPSLALSADETTMKSRTSLLTAQLSDAGLAPGSAEVTPVDPASTGCGASDSYGDFFLTRAASQPELRHQGDSWAYQHGCIMFSSPMLAESLGRIAEGDGAAEQEAETEEDACATSAGGFFECIPQSHTLAPPPPPPTLSPHWSRDGSSSHKASASTAFQPAPPPLRTQHLPEPSLSVPSWETAAIGCRTSPKRDVYEKTVRGGQPRRVCYYKAMRPQNPASVRTSSVPLLMAGSAAATFHQTAKQQHQQQSPPQLLSDMLRQALNRR